MPSPNARRAPRISVLVAIASAPIKSESAKGGKFVRDAGIELN